jgi:threonine dehydratase
VLAEQRGLEAVPSFHRDCAWVWHVRTRALHCCGPLDVVYVPVGTAGIVGLMTIRDLLGLDTEIVGVVAEEHRRRHCRSPRVLRSAPTQRSR